MTRRRVNLAFVVSEILVSKFDMCCSCLSYFSLLPYVFSQTEAHLDTLISEQASFILARSGVGSLYTVYQENRNQRVRKC